MTFRPNSVRMSGSKQYKKENAIKRLLGEQILKRGDTVYCILRHTASNGKKRKVSFLTASLRDFSYLTHQVLDLRVDLNQYLAINCDELTDIETVVSDLSLALFGDSTSLSYRWI